MKRVLNSIVWLFLFSAMISVVSCDKEEEIAFALSSLKSGTIDLNGATAATGVPTDAVITATFSKNLDVTGLTVTLKQGYDNAMLDVEIDVVGSTVTLTPDPMASGTSYTLSVSGVKSVDGETLPALERSFTTVGSFVPTGLFAYWPFDGNPNDAVGTFDPTSNQIVSITYGADRKGGAGGAAVFNGDNSIIEISNGSQLINATHFTISFWVKTDPTHDAGHFVFGLGAYYGIQYEIYGGYDGSKFAIQYDTQDALGADKNVAEDMWFAHSATDNTNGGWQGCTYAKSLTAEQLIAKLKDNWLHIVYTYNGTSKEGTLYYDGVKMKSFDFDLWPEGDDKTKVTGIEYAGAEPDVKNELAFGFIQSRGGTMWDAEGWGGYDFAGANHFKGSLDEFRIFHKALSAQEVTLLYNSEKQ